MSSNRFSKNIFIYKHFLLRVSSWDIPSFLWEYFIKILWLCSCLKTWITPSEIFIFKRKYTSWRHIINTDLCRLGGTYTICIMVEFQKSGWSTGLNVRDYVKICLKEHQSTYLNWTKLLQKGRSNCSGKLEWVLWQFGLSSF